MGSNPHTVLALRNGLKHLTGTHPVVCREAGRGATVLGAYHHLCTPLPSLKQVLTQIFIKQQCARGTFHQGIIVLNNLKNSSTSACIKESMSTASMQTHTSMGITVIKCVGCQCVFLPSDSSRVSYCICEVLLSKGKRNDMATRQGTDLILAPNRYLLWNQVIVVGL